MIESCIFIIVTVICQFAEVHRLFKNESRFTVSQICHWVFDNVMRPQRPADTHAGLSVCVLGS